MQQSIFALILSFIVFLTFPDNSLRAQCANQVMHTQGTENVNGIEVSVSSFGSVDTSTTYCPEVTQPYFIGINFTTGSVADGSYTFEFNPPINGLTLNFSGLSNMPPNSELITLSVNGAHYPLTEAGTDNGCDELAILSDEGNVEACEGCSVSGWRGTEISETISTLTVKDSIINGIPAGALFSLFICEAQTTNTDESQTLDLEVYPNPAQNILNITGKELIGSKLTVIDMHGQQLSIDPHIDSDQISLNISHLPAGVYFLSVNKKDSSSVFLRFIKS